MPYLEEGMIVDKVHNDDIKETLSIQSCQSNKDYEAYGDNPENYEQSSEYFGIISLMYISLLIE
jgi:hypothetical protein